jgi:hypothetical protein
LVITLRSRTKSPALEPNYGATDGSAGGVADRAVNRDRRGTALCATAGRNQKRHKRQELDFGLKRHSLSAWTLFAVGCFYDIREARVFENQSG